MVRFDENGKALNSARREVGAANTSFLKTVKGVTANSLIINVLIAGLPVDQPPRRIVLNGRALDKWDVTMQELESIKDQHISRGVRFVYSMDTGKRVQQMDEMHGIEEIMVHIPPDLSLSLSDRC